MAEALDGRLDPGNAGLKVWSLVRGMAADLKLAFGLGCLTLLAISVPFLRETAVSSALSLATLLFLPGYSCLAAIYPKKASLGQFERAALAFGLSVALAGFCWAGLAVIAPGAGSEAIVASLALLTILCLPAANFRRHEVPPSERYTADLRGACSSVLRSLFTPSVSRVNPALTILLLGSILLLFSVLSYSLLVPGQRVAYTEFYLLGPDGRAGNYPTGFSLGEAKPVLAGIVNDEHRTVDYTLVVALNDSGSSAQLYRQSVTLAPGETWEEAVPLQPDRRGAGMSMEFLLYADDDLATPYRSLHYTVNVA